jgi:hypothetical protein
VWCGSQGERECVVPLLVKCHCTGIRLASGNNTSLTWHHRGWSPPPSSSKAPTSIKAVTSEYCVLWHKAEGGRKGGRGGGSVWCPC